MIEIKNKKNKFTYNVYHVTKAFFPEEEIVQTVDEEQEPLVWMQLPGGACFSLAERSLTMADRKMTPEDEQTEKREVTREVYRFLSKKCDRELAWGMLTGVRQDCRYDQKRKSTFLLIEKGHKCRDQKDNPLNSHHFPQNVKNHSFIHRTAPISLYP